MSEKKIPFRHRNSFAYRATLAESVRGKHPDKIPIIIERYHAERQLPLLNKERYLVPEHLTMAGLSAIIRREMHLHPSQAIFLLVNQKSMVSISKTMSEIYHQEKDIDGFLYISYTSQDVFGNSCNN